MEPYPLTPALSQREKGRTGHDEIKTSSCRINKSRKGICTFAASAMQRYFRDAKAVRKQNRFFGGVLVAVGMALFFVKRNPQA